MGLVGGLHNWYKKAVIKELWNKNFHSKLTQEDLDMINDYYNCSDITPVDCAYRIIYLHKETK